MMPPVPVELVQSPLWLCEHWCVGGWPPRVSFRHVAWSWDAQGVDLIAAAVCQWRGCHCV